MAFSRLDGERLSTDRFARGSEIGCKLRIIPGPPAPSGHGQTV